MLQAEGVFLSLKLDIHICTSAFYSIVVGALLLHA